MNPKLWDMHATYGYFLMTNQRFKEAVHMRKKVHLNLAEIPIENKLNINILFNIILLIRMVLFLFCLLLICFTFFSKLNLFALSTL